MEQPGERQRSELAAGEDHFNEVGRDCSILGLALSHAVGRRAAPDENWGLRTLSPILRCDA